MLKRLIPGPRVLQKIAGCFFIVPDRMMLARPVGPSILEALGFRNLLLFVAGWIRGNKRADYSNL